MSEAHDLLDDVEAGELAVEYDDQPPEAVLTWALERYGSRIALCTSFQAEGMVLLDMAWRIDPKVRVFTIDTGRQYQETYDLMDVVRERYQLPIEIYSPDTREVEAMTLKHGVNLFYRSVPLRLHCCQVRKVHPLQRVLDGLDGWITGLRRETWASRSNIRKIEIDHDHGGIAKVSPLADWTHEEVWEYIRAHDVPYHKLYDQGFTSIGCAPCTRKTAPGEDPRAGRWWWETNAPKECGMHCTIETGGFEHELEVLLDRPR
ncbi:MAG TPA: phosphoadenylyl-sulfate reductase [Gemmatimonadales bacterium]|nr:phosphoadenylyl-sulfate reductase [Gemmatimonadales bacterium]